MEYKIGDRVKIHEPYYFTKKLEDDENYFDMCIFPEMYPSMGKIGTIVRMKFGDYYTIVMDDTKLDYRWSWKDICFIKHIKKKNKFEFVDFKIYI